MSTKLQTDTQEAPFKTSNTQSIRTHLLLLVLAVSVPLMVAGGYSIYTDMQQTIAHTKASLRTLAITMVSNTGGKIAHARQTLERLATRPLVKQVDGRNCDPVLTELHAFNPAYANVTYTDLNGIAVCSAVPQPGGKPVNVGKAPWFQTLMKERRFTVGQPFLGPITGKWVSVLSAPIWNDRKEMIGGVEIPLDLNAFDPGIPTQFLPDGTRYGFLTEDGIVVWRNADPEDVIGTRLRVEAVQQALDIRDGEFEAEGVDGLRRFYSVIPMPETGWIARVGVPTSAIYAGPMRRAMTEAAIAAIVIAFLLLAALVIARRIARPVVELNGIAHAIHDGNLDARAVVVGPTEVAEVALEFNAMVSGLQLSQRKLQQSELRHQETEKIGKVGGWEFQIDSGRQTWTEQTYHIHEVDLTYQPTVENGINFYTPASRPIIEHVVHYAIERGEPFDVELEIMTARDNIRSVHAIGRPDIEHRRVYGFLQDITERKQAELELKRSNAELEQFSYAISHDMRQPLRMISSYMRLLEESISGKLDGEQREYFNFAIEGAKRMDIMMVGLLEYSRVGRKGEPPVWVESRTVRDEVLLFLQPAIAEAQAEVRIQGEWPRILVSQDEMLRLLQNLIGNAIKFHVAGRKPEIIVTSQVVDKEWRLCVADNGVGLLPDQIGRLFQVFQRLQSRADYEGSGIGLALCRKIAEHHQGHIWAESAGEGQGSRFCVALPQEKFEQPV